MCSLLVTKLPRKALLQVTASPVAQLLCFVQTDINRFLAYFNGVQHASGKNLLVCCGNYVRR